MSQMTNRVKTTLCKTNVAAGATDITDATEIDMSGFEGVRFLFGFGTITAGAATSVAATGKTSTGGTPGTDDLEGTSVTVADTYDDKMVILDIWKPRQRYIRPFIKRATQNAVVNYIIAEQYGRKGPQPVTKDTTVAAQELHVSKAVGTA